MAVYQTTSRPTWEKNLGIPGFEFTKRTDPTERFFAHQKCCVVWIYTKRTSVLGVKKKSASSSVFWWFFGGPKKPDRLEDSGIKKPQFLPWPAHSSFRGHGMTSFLEVDFTQKGQFKSITLTHTIVGTRTIYLHEWLIYVVNVPMDGMRLFLRQVLNRTLLNCSNNELQHPPFRVLERFLKKNNSQQFECEILKSFLASL